MGRVLLARDPVLGRDVALKVLRDDLQLTPERESRSSPRACARRRARLPTVRHPNLVTLHDMGDDDVFGVYLVFEYVAGPTLRERLASGALHRSRSRALRWSSEPRSRPRTKPASSIVT